MSNMAMPFRDMFSFIHYGSRTKFVLLMFACLIDAADKALLSSTFKAFEATLQVGPRLLGLLNFYQSMSFAVALPAWGLALEHGWESTDLLMLGCYGFGLMTCLLAGILSQIIPEDRRGFAFGVLQSSTALAALATSYFATTSDKTTWRQSHLAIGIMSFFVAWAIWKYMPPQESKVSPNILSSSRSEKGHEKGTFSRMYDTCKRIFGMKTFCFMVLQGLFGGIPWNAMAFLPMYWQTCGYSDGQTGMLGVSQGVGMAVGGMLGGIIGDHMAKIFPNSGRIITAQLSVALGIPTFCAIFYMIPCEAHGEHVYLASFLVFLFGAVASWPPASSLRPMCAELMTSPVEQGQIVALWVMLEGITSSVFGSPLVGWLTEVYGYNDHDPFSGSARSQDHDPLEGDMPIMGTTESANALAKSLVGVSTLAWLICLLVWTCMLKTYPDDKSAAESRGKYDKVYSPFDEHAV